MYPDQQYAPAVGSFQRQVLPPTFDPDASPTKTISINCQWLPYIRGALLQLVLQATWDAATPADLLLVQERAMTLIAMFEECATSALPFACPYDWSGLSQEGWFLDPVFGSIGYAPSAIGVFTGFNLGWHESTADDTHNTIQGAFIDLTVDPTAQLTLVEFEYRLVKGTFPHHDFTSGIWLLDGSGGVIDSATVAAHTLPDTMRATYLFANPSGWTGVHTVRMGIMCDEVPSGTGATGACQLFTAQVRGSGPAPC